MANLMFSLPHYSYKPLTRNSIRVLELHPAASDAPLHCTIVTQGIGDQAYDALSYVWGDPTPAALIKCRDEVDEGELGIGRGLALALLAFRLTDQTRRIWVDALCINQKDVAERQSQVRLMGFIYEQAQRVLCWLGPFDDQVEDAESRARLAIHFLRSFNDEPQERLQEARQYLHGEDDTADTEGPLLDSWLAVKELFDIEYFHRAWIIQEVGLARDARFFWGNQDLWLDWTEVATFCYFMDNNGASVINHLQLKSWVANHINLVWATDSAGKPTHNFVEVLHWARVHRSTDPRDYIYALLSHPSATVNGSLLVQPNYSITPAQAYIELALNVIERTKSLLILAFVDHHEEAGTLILPTWVPDWHALNLVAPIRCPTQAATGTDDSFSFAESEKGMIIKCRGFSIDTLRAMTDMIEPSGLIVTTLEKEMRKRIPFLIDHIWTKLVVESGIPLASVKEFLAALSLVLTGGYFNTSDSTSGEIQEQQQSDLAAFVLEYERIRVDGYSDRFFTNLSTEEKALIQDMAAKGSAHQFVQDMTWTSMCRKVFRTANGHIGLGPRIMKEGDLCVILLGAIYPMILRRCDNYFQLIGPALLYGYMNGEAEKLSQNGALAERGFEII
jgi:hypothetical protein